MQWTGKKHIAVYTHNENWDIPGAGGTVSVMSFINGVELVVVTASKSLVTGTLGYWEELSIMSSDKIKDGLVKVSCNVPSYLSQEVLSPSLHLWHFLACCTFFDMNIFLVVFSNNEICMNLFLNTKYFGHYSLSLPIQSTYSQY